jgi:glycosyltransferase involved in cell wall biosynthesis
MKGASVELSCLESRAGIEGVRVNVHRQWPVFQRFAVSSDFVRFLKNERSRFEIVHNHSLWSMVNVTTGCLVPGGHARLVTSPRGTLSEWALNRRRQTKSLLWPWQRLALERADLLHATSNGECGDMRAQHLSAPVAVIPNGIDLPVMVTKRPSAARRRMLFLGRIHSTKGVVELLDAWRQVEASHPEWTLMVAGKGESRHEQQVRARCDELRLQHVEFPGPLYGREKAKVYFEAEVFILPSHSENFGMTVAEALAHGCPVIATKGTPWAGLETERCGWWVAQGIPNLAEAMSLAMSMPADRLATMGALGREWMARDFAWDAVAEQMLAAYRWLVNGGTPPPSIRLD